MTEHRFFVDPAAVAGAVGAEIEVPASIAHQLARVLRLRAGATVVLLDGSGSQVRCRLTAAGGLLIEERGEASGEPRHRLTVGQALLKGDGLEQVVQQGTELGVARFALLVTRRSVVRELSERRLARLRAVAREAAEQSERGLVPAIDGPLPLAAALVPGAVLLAERSDSAARLGALPPPPALLVGPEGGFDDGELAVAERGGVTFASLGPRILRAESVAIAAAAVVLSRSGDFA